MYALLALAASLLTALLPILNKLLLRDARPAMVAWAINAASLPILAAGTYLLMQCSLARPNGAPALACVTTAPRIDLIFIAAIAGSAALNWGATLLSTHALSAADASLVGPLLTFNPAFTLLLAWVALGETPGWREAIGVAIILIGAYLLDAKQAQIRLLAPAQALLRRPGTLLAIAASALWGATTVLEKVAIEHTSPPSGPLVAMTGTTLTVLLLTPGAFKREHDKEHAHSPGWGVPARHPRVLTGAALIAGVAPLFGFTAIALGNVGYVTALFKLSAVFTILLARVFLGEGNLRERLLGATVMLVGGALIAT